MKGTKHKRIDPLHRGTGASLLPAGRLLLLLILTLAGAAQAQRAVVITASLSATRQSARIYAQAVDLETGEALAGGGALPGSSLLETPISGVFADQDHLPDGFVAVSTGPSDPPLHPDPGYPETSVSLVRPWPFTVTAGRFHDSEAGWREWAADVMPGPASPGLLVVGSRAGETSDSPLVGRARLFGGADHDAAMIAEWPLPGAPVAGVWMPAVKSALVLCAGHPAAAPVLVKCELGAGQTLRRAAGELAGWNPACTDARALAWLPGTDFSILAFSGRILGGGSTEPVSQVYVVDSKGLTVLAGPVSVRGMVDRIHAVAGQDLWIASRAPGTDFAYATKLHVDPASGTATLETEYPLTGAMEGFELAPDPLSGTVAAAVGARLEIWPNGQRGEVRQEYDNSVRTLCWTAAGILVGEAGRVHLADPATGASKRRIQLQTGHIAAILPIMPGRQATDDGPGSTYPANKMIVPPAVLFRGEAAGRELRAMNVDCSGAPGQWRVEYDAALMPWLVIHPLSGHGSGTVYLGVDPARYLPHTLAEGWLTVSLEGGAPPVPAVDSPVKVLARVEPAPASARTILWLWPDTAAQMRDPADPRGMAGLASQLAATPLYFSHAESSDPVASSLDPYAVIVLHAGAAVRGVVSRQALVDYVADGGGLLVVADGDKAQAETLGPWLAPFGVVTVSDPPPAQNAGLPHAALEPLQSWPSTPMPAAYGFRAAIGGAKDPFAPNALKVLRVPERPADAPALFLARSFGYGRVALLATDAPLRAASSGGPPERFARELFVWLAGAGISAQDMDRDGLTDDLEDVNGNGVRDPGETDWLRADTDGDGIPDGLEDWNRNGIVDPGETDPRNPDTDGDGVWDGADPSPAPVYDAPRIAGVMPYAGPAEGGGIVLVRGEGLLPGAEYRFGDQPAECIAPGDGSRALVRVPELAGDDGGAVSVSVILPGRGLRAELPGGYQYQPRSRAQVGLVPLEPPLLREGIVHGRMRVVLTVSPPCAFANVAVSLDPSTTPGFSWEASPSKGASLHISTSTGGEISMLGQVRPNGADGGTFAEIKWTCPGLKGGVVEFPAPRALALTLAGGPFHTEATGVSVTIP